MLQKGFFFFSFFDEIIFVLLMPALFDSRGDGFDFILKLNSTYLVLGNFGDQFPLQEYILYNMPLFASGFCTTLPI
jgi:hypothetical protein